MQVCRRLLKLTIDFVITSCLADRLICNHNHRQFVCKADIYLHNITAYNSLWLYY